MRMLASGVRSSWETLASRSVRSRSEASSTRTCCWVWASRTATAAASACSRSSRSSWVLVRRSSAASRSASIWAWRRPEPTPPAATAPRGEDHQVDQVAGVGDGQCVQGGDEEVVDEQEAERRAGERRAEAAQGSEHRHQGDVDEDVVARRGCSGRCSAAR